MGPKLKRVERDAHREHEAQELHIHRLARGAHQLVERLNAEVCILEEREQAEVDKAKKRSRRQS